MPLPFLLKPRMTLARTIKLYKLPDTPQTPGLRVMEDKDVPGVTAMLNDYLKKFRVTQVFSEEEVAHMWVGGAGVGLAGRCAGGRTEGGLAGRGDGRREMVARSIGVHIVAGKCLLCQSRLID